MTFEDVSSEIRSLGRVTEAKGTRISDVRPILLSYPYPEEYPVFWSSGVVPGVTTCLVKVTTDDGHYGLGETYAGNFAPEVAQAVVLFYREFLIGEDPSNISELWKKCYSRVLLWGRFGISVAVLSAVESALWDLCGKLLDIPVFKLLGGELYDSLPVYASGGMSVDPTELTKEMREYVDAGFTVTKIRIGDDAESCAQKVEQVIEAGAGDLGIAVDAVQGSAGTPWGESEALEVGRRLAEYDLLWFEEPCGTDDIAGYVECRRHLTMPISGGENCTTLDDARRFIDAGAVDYIQTDAAWVGGILEAKRVAAYADARGVKTIPHVWGGGGTVMSNYHTAFTIPGCSRVELPTQANPLINELMVEPLRLVDGQVRLPTKPGLGIDISPEIELRYAYSPGYHAKLW